MLPKTNPIQDNLQLLLPPPKRNLTLLFIGVVVIYILIGFIVWAVINICFKRRQASNRLEEDSAEDLLSPVADEQQDLLDILDEGAPADDSVTRREAEIVGARVVGAPLVRAGSKTLPIDIDLTRTPTPPRSRRGPRRHRHGRAERMREQLENKRNENVNVVPARQARSAETGYKLNNEIESQVVGGRPLWPTTEESSRPRRSVEGFDFEEKASLEERPVCSSETSVKEETCTADQEAPGSSLQSSMPDS